jgi:transposase InsO family protein
MALGYNNRDSDKRAVVTLIMTNQGVNLIRPCSLLQGKVRFLEHVILDIFSRYVIGWMVAHREFAALARKLIEETCEKQSIQPGQLYWLPTINILNGSNIGYRNR